MKYALVFALLFFQLPEERWPGQNEHQPPPEGWYCEHQNYDFTVPPAHVCSCERSRDQNGNIIEDRNCAAWCHMSHCHCYHDREQK